MIKDSRERELPNGGGDPTEFRTGATVWTSLQNPRIVRVSRAFAGKDRHSKVSTVRGLRDRRVRLSVPTAIQLYDLQDKLGLNQPSKVVEWLINAAQHEIDKLPPLHFPQAWASSSALDAARTDEQDQFKIGDSVLVSNDSICDIAALPKSTCLNSEAMSYTFYHQNEPQAQDFHLGSALSPSSIHVMPPSISSYLASPNDFENPSTFVQLPPWSSSMYANTIYFKDYIHQDEPHQQVESMRQHTEAYKDCGAAHGSDADDFL